MTGQVPPDEVAAHLASADVLALPNTATSISERYTSPLKLFEYMAAGRPIVVSDLPAIREIVRHGESAWLVAPGDAAALAAGIGRVTRASRDRAAHGGGSLDRRGRLLVGPPGRAARGAARAGRRPAMTGRDAGR